MLFHFLTRTGIFGCSTCSIKCAPAVHGGTGFENPVSRIYTLHAQGIESIRVPRLPFSKKNKKGDRTRALASVEALRNWAKAQAVMLYGGER